MSGIGQVVSTAKDYHAQGLPLVEGAAAMDRIGMSICDDFTFKCVHQKHPATLRVYEMHAAKWQTVGRGRTV
jgi:hypothetical protein